MILLDRADGKGVKRRGARTQGTTGHLCLPKIRERRGETKTWGRGAVDKIGRVQVRTVLEELNKGGQGVGGPYATS